MNQKFKKLSNVSFVLAVVLFALSFVLFHFLTDSGFTAAFQQEAGKPFVTEMAADLGVLFFFCSILCRMIAKIFFSDET
jgi:multisubunit Na+/H+ antiporter MnhB subunit